MEIKHLKYFKKAQQEWDKFYSREPFLISKPLSIQQIEIVEKAIYKTETKKLPCVLRELLFLSGGFCPFFATGIQPYKKGTLEISDLLDDQNFNPYFEFLEERNNVQDCFKNRLIWSFNTVYESSNKFYFVYLDEDNSDPFVYTFDGDRLHEYYSNDLSIFIGRTHKTLSSFIFHLYAMEMKIENRPISDESIYSTYLTSDDIVTKNENLNTFYSFISSRNLPGVNYFIEQGIDVNADNNKAILKAAEVSDLKAIEMLVTYGANLYDQNEKVLLVAAKLSNPNFIQYLVNNYDFSQTAKDKALVIICSRGIRTSAIYIIKAGADINAFNSLGFQIALRNEHFHFAAELANDLGANKKVNSGYILLFKKRIEQEIRHAYSKEKLFENIKRTHFPIQIIQKHNNDLKTFFENNSTIDDFPSKINIEIDNL